MFKIGITGNSGAGKNFICNHLQDKDEVPTYDVDIICKRLTNENVSLKEEITNLFGTKSYLITGEYNSKYIANIIFNNSVMKKELEELIGYYLMEDYTNWILLKKKEGNLLCFVNCAYFYELNIDYMVDMMIGVHCLDTIRIERIIKRDNISYDDVLLRFNNQMDQELKMEKCHFVYDNSTLEIDEKKLDKIYFQITKFARILNNQKIEHWKFIQGNCLWDQNVKSDKSFEMF